MSANPLPALRICPSEFPTAPIAEISCGRFGTEGSGQVNRPTVLQSAAPRVSRRERRDVLSTGDPDGLLVGKAQVSVDLRQPTANL